MADLQTLDLAYEEVVDTAALPEALTRAVQTALGEVVAQAQRVAHRLPSRFEVVTYADTDPTRTVVRVECEVMTAAGDDDG